MVKIHRIWFNTERMDREDHYKITLTCGMPSYGMQERKP